MGVQDFKFKGISLNNVLQTGSAENVTGYDMAISVSDTAKDNQRPNPVGYKLADGTDIADKALANTANYGTSVSSLIVPGGATHVRVVARGGGGGGGGGSGGVLADAGKDAWADGGGGGTGGTGGYLYKEISLANATVNNGRKYISIKVGAGGTAGARGTGKLTSNNTETGNIGPIGGHGGDSGVNIGGTVHVALGGRGGNGGAAAYAGGAGSKPGAANGNTGATPGTYSGNWTNLGDPTVGSGGNKGNAHSQVAGNEWANPGNSGNKGGDGKVQVFWLWS